MFGYLAYTFLFYKNIWINIIEMFLNKIDNLMNNFFKRDKNVHQIFKISNYLKI